MGHWIGHCPHCGRHHVFELAQSHDFDGKFLWFVCPSCQGWTEIRDSVAEPMAGKVFNG